MSMRALVLVGWAFVGLVGQVFEEVDDEVSVLQTDVRVRKRLHSGVSPLEGPANDHSNLKVTGNNRDIGRGPKNVAGEDVPEEQWPKEWQGFVTLGGCKSLDMAKGMGIMCKSDLSHNKKIQDASPGVAGSLCDKCAASCKAAGQECPKHGKEPMLYAIPWILGMLLLLGGAYVIALRSDDSISERLPKYVAEFLGTSTLVFAIGCNAQSTGQGFVTWGVTSVAFTLMVSIYALGPISGANFNPAVSLALALSNKLPWIEAFVYILVQLAAGIFGGLAFGTFFGESTMVGPTSGHRGWQAGLAELLYTFLLTFVVLNTCASPKKNEYYGLAIALAVVAGGYGAGNISGGCFNPAAALGMDSSGFAVYYHWIGPFPSNVSGFSFGWCLAYWVFELIGCLLATVMFRVCRPEDLDVSEDASEEIDENPIIGLFAKLNVPFRALVSEFLGTYFLVLTVGLNVLTSSKAAAFSIAASLMSMIFALGSVSGAHFNPAVTLAIVCSGRDCIKPHVALYYVAVQVFAGICGAFTYMLLMNGQTVALAPAPGASSQALVGELVFTCLLCFVVLSVATGKNQLSEYVGLAIGACVVAGGFAIGSVSGGSLNPAVSAGLALSDSTNGGTLEHFVSYTVVELFGGCLAALIFRKTHVIEYPKKVD